MTAAHAKSRSGDSDDRGCEMREAESARNSKQLESLSAHLRGSQSSLCELEAQDGELRIPLEYADVKQARIGLRPDLFQQGSVPDGALRQSFCLSVRVVPAPSAVPRGNSLLTRAIVTSAPAHFAYARSRSASEIHGM